MSEILLSDFSSSVQFRRKHTSRYRLLAVRFFFAPRCVGAEKFCQQDDLAPRWFGADFLAQDILTSTRFGTGKSWLQVNFSAET